MAEKEQHILLSNDDGIDSPGLWAAANALSEIAYVTVAAPREHMSATGRGVQKNADGMITKKHFTIKDQTWDVYAIGGSPSQSVLFAILEIMDKKPDLVVSGINYGENFGTDITMSGTVGAAIEAASLGIPALAVSQQIIFEDWDSFHHEVDFSGAAYFTKYFAKKMLDLPMPEEVDVINVTVPEGADEQTPWKLTPLAKMRYFLPYVIREGGWDEKGRITSHILDTKHVPPENDIHTVRVEKKVAVTPLTIDLTAHSNIKNLDQLLR